MKTTRIHLLSVGTIASMISASPAASQMITAAPAASQAKRADDSPHLEDIIVTAQKTSQNLQVVPLAVSALTSTQLAQKGVEDTTALSAAVPGLVFVSAANVGNPFIRGVGTNQAEANSEQSVSLYIDGVLISAPTANMFSFSNIDRIEVLKGPQGTLFGRNATGGIIQIITRDPSSKPSLDLSVNYGNYGTLKASAYATGGLGENLKAGLSVDYANQSDGWGRNLTTGADTFKQAIGNISVRTKWVFTPSASTRITFAGDYAHLVNTDAYQQPPGVTSPFDPSVTYPGRYNTYDGLQTKDRVNTGGASLKIDQDVGNLHFVSITSYRRTHALYSIDEDGTPAAIQDLVAHMPAHNWTQEFQIHGPTAGRIKWVVGAFYYDAFAGYVPLEVNGQPVLSDFQKTRSYAGFGQATARTIFDINLTGGLRYSTEDQNFGFPAAPVLNRTQHFSKWTYRIALDKQITDTVFGYVSYNVGFKSGGFGLTSPPSSFKPEVLKAVEIGLKSEFFDRHVRLNLAAFDYDYQDIQVTVPQGPLLVILNAASARIRGVDADFQVIPVRNLTFSGGLTYLHGRYLDFPNALAISSEGIQAPSFDASGNVTTFTPKLTGTFTIDYRAKMAFGTLRPSATVSYNDGFFFTVDNRLRQSSYTLLNASLTWTSKDQRTDVSLWAKNIADVDYRASLNEASVIGDRQEQAPPRTFGITVTRHFG